MNIPTSPGEVLARTIWAEAGIQGRLGMEAVASVILNRAAHPRWWGKDVRDVCLHPYQFSCWLPEPTGQLHRLLTVTTMDPLFKTALAVSADALAGHLVDHTNGADSYVNLSVARPAWAAEHVPCAFVGMPPLQHTFYRLELRAPDGPVPVGKPVPVAPVAVSRGDDGAADRLMELEQERLEMG